MARVFKTLSLSLPPDVVDGLAKIGGATKRVAARVAADIVLREMARIPTETETRRQSSCCRARVVPVRGVLVVPESVLGDRRWVPVVVLLCDACKGQVRDREYEGWIADAEDAPVRS
jgi:hypothetical protein